MVQVFVLLSSFHQYGVNAPTYDFRRTILAHVNCRQCSVLEVLSLSSLPFAFIT
jgi:hypothetical protein